MKTCYVPIDLRNALRADIAAVRGTALADTGAMMLCLPRRVSDALRLETAEERRVELADGSDVTVPYVGPIRVRFGERACFVGAFVMGDEVILGAVPMEDMDLVVSPLTRTVSIREKPSRHLV
jgi:clan AA aspartic protease